MSFGLLAISAAAHLIAFAALRLVPPLPPRPVTLDVEAIELRAIAAREPAMAPATPPEAEAPAQAAAPPSAPAQQRRPRPTPPPPRKLPGTTLKSADDASSWSSAIGDETPLLAAVPAVASPEPVRIDAAPPGPRVVPLAALGRKPQAPRGLDDLLRRYYPPRARVQGVEGKVVVRMRILPSGRVAEIRVLQERPTGFEFASACREMLQRAPAFVPPLDRSGERVAADVAFTCTFEVDY